MSFKLRLTDEAIKDIQKHKKSGDKKILKKIVILLEELKEQPQNRYRAARKITI